MTVCIAALCAGRDGSPSKAAIVASDRMVTLGGLTEFEHEVPKITFIHPQIATLMAGDALRGSLLNRELSKACHGLAPNVEDTALTAGNLYSTLRGAQIEADVFRPRGVTREAFYKGEIAGLNQQQQLFFQIDQHITKFDFGVHMLVSGVDQAGAHLYAVGNPGGAVNFQQIGYHAIGSGGHHAMQSMIGFQHCCTRSLEETLFSVYVSKRRAEVAPGVGRETDMYILESGKVTHVSNENLASLSGIMDEYLKPAADDMLAKAKALL